MLVAKIALRTAREARPALAWAIFLPLFVAATLSACSTGGSPAATPTPDQTGDVRATMDRYNQFMVQKNAAGIAGLFAPEGEVYDTGLLEASGPDAIRTYMTQSLGAMTLASFTSSVDTIIIQAKVGVALGIYDEVGANGHDQKIRYVAEWILQPDGRWLLHRFSTTPFR